MKKTLLTMAAFLAILISIPTVTQASNPNVGYTQLRYQIACRDNDTNDARCFWNKVAYIHAKEILGTADNSEYLSETEVGRIEKKIKFLEARHESFCTDTDEPAYFCNAILKLVDSGNWFLENEQALAPEEDTNDEDASSSLICSTDTYNCGDYSNQSEAQSVFDYCMSEVQSDIHNLDGDGNGIACESL